nr:hypothetical protein Iba_chr05bCG3420 [Ipomoea batatas]
MGSAELLSSSIAFAAEGNSTAFSTSTVPSLPSSLFFKDSQGLSISTVFDSSGACLCNTTSGSSIAFAAEGNSTASTTSIVPLLPSSLFFKYSRGISISTVLVSSGACLCNTTSGSTGSISYSVFIGFSIGSTELLGSSIAFATEGNSTAFSTSTIPPLPSSLFFKDSKGLSISGIISSSVLIGFSMGSAGHLGSSIAFATEGSIGSISSSVLIGFSMGSVELLGSSIAFATEDNSTAFSTSTVPSLPSSLFFNDSQGLSISTILEKLLTYSLMPPTMSVKPFLHAAAETEKKLARIVMIFCTLLFHFTDAFTYCDGYIVILLIGFSMGSAGHLGSSIAFATEGSIGSISSSVLIGFSMGSGELLGSSIAFATEGNSTAFSTSTVPSLPSSLFFNDSQGLSISTMLVLSGACLSSTTSGSTGCISSFSLFCKKKGLSC